MTTHLLAYAFGALCGAAPCILANTLARFAARRDRAQVRARVTQVEQGEI